MSFEPPAGILDIGNATLRVGKLEVAETTGLNQGLQNIMKNDLLITESTTYTSSQHWGLKLPTTWVAEFDLKGETGKYLEFNFYNEGFTSNTSGYTLNFTDTSLTLKYDNGSTLASATIPTIVGTFRKVHIFFERNVIAVSIDGTRYLYDKRPSVLSRVISTTGSAFLNLFVEDNSNASLVAFKNLRIVNGRFISDETSNIAFVGGNLGVGVHSPTESLDVLGSIKTRANVHVTGNVYAEGEIELYSNLNIQHVSNTSTIKANSNVVTEFPRSKKLIKYPRVALSTNAGNHSALGSGYTQDGYTVKVSSELNATLTGTKAFTNTNLDNADTWISDQLKYSSGTPVSVTTNVNKFGQNGEWLEIKLPNKIKLSSTRIFSRRTYFTERNDTADIWASNTGTDGDWVKLTTINFNDAYTDVIPMVADIDTLTYYQYFAIQITEVGWTNGTYVNIGEWELFGVPEYDPEAHGTDVVVKSIPNVPNTDWVEVYYEGKNYSGSGDVQDETSNDIDATIGAATTFDSVNKAWSFSGASNRDGTEFVSGYLPSDFEGNQIHSVSMWLKFDYWHEGAFCIIGKETRTNSDSHKAIHFQFQDTSSARPRILYDFWDNQKSFYLPDDVQPGKWLHMTATYTGNAAIRKMFVNGQELTTFTTNSNYATALALDTTNDLVVRLGSRYPVNSTYTFHGDIANFRLFNRPLTSDEVWQLYAYQKEYFGHGDLSMTLKAGRLGIGTSEPRAALEVMGDIIGSSPVYFYLGIDDDNHVGATTKIPFHIIRANKGGGYDVETYNFTAPIGGWYWMAFGGVNRSASTVLHMSLKDGPNSSNTTLLMAYDRPYGNSLMQSSRSGMVYIREGGIVSLWVTSGTVDAGNGIGGASVEWGGFLVSREFQGEN